MLWSRLDNNIIRDEGWIALQEDNPASFWMFLHLLDIAREANNQGKILNGRGRPVQIAGFVRVGKAWGWDETTWARFLETAHTEGVIDVDEEDGHLCYRIARWDRWYLAPSASPEAVRERVAKHRANKASAYSDTPDADSSRYVTDVTNVTTYSTAQHSTSDSTEQKSTAQRRTAQHPPPTPSDGGGAADDEERTDGRDPLAEVFLGLQPSGLSQRFLRDVAALRRTPGACEEDVLAGARAAVAKTVWVRDRTEESVSRPPAYALELARGMIPEAMERRRSNEARAKIGLSTKPYTWEPPSAEEDRDCA